MIPIPLGPLHIANIGRAPSPPAKRPIPRRAPQHRQHKRPQGPQPCSTSSQSEENHNLDVSSSSDSSSMTAINQMQMQPPPAHRGHPPPHRPPLPRQPPQPVSAKVHITQGGQRGNQRPRSNTPSMNSSPSPSAECDNTCDCALFTGSELEKDVEVGGKNILVADLKHFFRRTVDGTWTCKKCA
jgi:hypothetical protein